MLRAEAPVAPWLGSCTVVSRLILSHPAPSCRQEQSPSSHPACPHSGRLRGTPMSWARRAAAALCTFWSCYCLLALKPLTAGAKPALLGKRGHLSSLLLMQQLSCGQSGKGPEGHWEERAVAAVAGLQAATGNTSFQCSGSLLPPTPPPHAPAPPCPHVCAGASGGDSSCVPGVSTGPAQPARGHGALGDPGSLYTSSFQRHNEQAPG